MFLLPLLVLTSMFFYTWSLNDQLWPADNDRSNSLAKDALQAASSSVHEAMQALFEAYEDELRATSERNAIHRSSAKLERLQLSLDSLYQKSSPLHNITIEERPGLQLINERHLAGMHQIDICESLSGKRITMTGGEHVYRLHMLLLQHRERAEGKQFPCQYHEFCTHHHICLPYHQQLQDNTPQPRYIKPPTAQELMDTESAVVNYIVSDTLYSARNESSWEYTMPFVDPTTGIRLRETYWLAAARKANIVILGRGPLSAPGQTYQGNWSFLRHVPDYVDKSRAAIIGGYKSPESDVHAMNHRVPRSLEILNAAAHLTISRFLPDLFQLLRSIRREVHPGRRKPLIWPSSWYRLPGRGVARTVLILSESHVRSNIRDMLQLVFFQRRRSRSSKEDVPVLHLSTLLVADVMHTTHHEDPWALLYNAQGKFMG